MDVLCTQLRAWVARQGILKLADLRDAAAAALGLCQVSPSTDSSPGSPEGAESLASLLSLALQQASSTPGIQGLIEQELDAWLLLAEPGMPLPAAASHHHLPHLPLLESVLLEAARTHLHTSLDTTDPINKNVPDTMEITTTSSSKPSATSATASFPIYTTSTTAAASDAVLAARQDLFLPERWLLAAPVGTDLQEHDHSVPPTADDTPTWQDRLQQQHKVEDHAEKEARDMVQQEVSLPATPTSQALVHLDCEKQHLPCASPTTPVRRTSSSCHSTLSTSSSSLDSLDMPLRSCGSCSSTASSSSAGEGGVYATVVLRLASPASKAAAVAAKTVEEGVVVALVGSAVEAAEASAFISSTTTAAAAEAPAAPQQQHKELSASGLGALRAHYQQQPWWPAAQLLLAALVSAFTLQPTSYGPATGTGGMAAEDAEAGAAGLDGDSSECFWRCTPRSAAVAWLQLPHC